VIFWGESAVLRLGDYIMFNTVYVHSTDNGFNGDASQ
jgi:hypothetical protein